MAYEYDLAQRLKAMGRPSPYAAGWYRAACAEVTPRLRFSAADGALLFEGESLVMTATAAARQWQKGSEAAAILSGGRLLIIDKL